MRPTFFWSSGIFVLKVLMKHVISLIGWLRIRMNLKLVALMFTSHLLASLLVPLLCVLFGTVLIMTILLVLIIFLMIALLDLVI